MDRNSTSASSLDGSTLLIGIQKGPLRKFTFERQREAIERREFLLRQYVRHVAKRGAVGFEGAFGHFGVQRFPYCTATRPTRSRATISFMMPAVPSPISRPITSRMRC